MSPQLLHEQALKAARAYCQAEADLLSILQKIDEAKAYRAFSRTSLFDYAVSELRLSEHTALNFINVARKSAQVPALKEQIEAGELSVSKARKIVPVLTLENQEEWIEKAKTLTSRALEKEVARVAPQVAQPERVKYLTDTRMSLSLSVDEKTMEALRRVQDLESQRLRRAVTLEEALQAMSALYLERKDPVVRAERLGAKAEAKKVELKNAEPRSNQIDSGEKPSDVPGHMMTGKPRPTPRKPFRAPLKRQVILRDGGRCTEILPGGSRCSCTRWLDVHHVQPLSEGGTDTLENLVTLCSAHHRARHRARAA